MHLFKAYARSATTDIDKCTEYSLLIKTVAHDLKCSRVARTLWPQSTAKDSSRRHKIFVCNLKSAVRDFVLFTKSAYFTAHFGCIFSL